MTDTSMMLTGNAFQCVTAIALLVADYELKLMLQVKLSRPKPSFVVYETERLFFVTELRLSM